MLSVVNVSIVNIALPTMAADLGVNVPSISWVVTGFLVTQATLLAPAGRAGDLYGRRRIFVIGVLVLCVASVLCALAWNAPSLVAFRILQAVGACAMAPTAYAYAAELFGPRERGVALGVMGGVLGLAPVLSLNIAGVLVGALGWRSVFWFTPVLGVFVLAGAALVLVESKPPDADRDFDLPGAGLAAVGLFSVLVALSRGETWGWGSWPTTGAFVLGAASLALFARHELRAQQPDDRPAAAAPPVPRHLEPGGHGVLGRALRDAHPAALLHDRGPRLRAVPAGPGHHPDRRVLHARGAARGAGDRPGRLRPARDDRVRHLGLRRRLDGPGGGVAGLRRPASRASSRSASAWRPRPRRSP